LPVRHFASRRIRAADGVKLLAVVAGMGHASGAATLSRAPSAFCSEAVEDDAFRREAVEDDAFSTVVLRAGPWGAPRVR